MTDNFDTGDSDLWNYLNNIGQQLESLLNYDQPHELSYMGDQLDSGQASKDIVETKPTTRPHAVSAFKDVANYNLDGSSPDATPRPQQVQGQESICPSSGVNTTQQVEFVTQFNNSYYPSEAYYLYQQQQQEQQEQQRNQAQRDFEAYQYQHHPMTLDDTIVSSLQQIQPTIDQSKSTYNCAYCEWLERTSANPQVNMSQLNTSQFYSYFNNMNNK